MYLFIFLRNYLMHNRYCALNYWTSITSDYYIILMWRQKWGQRSNVIAHTPASSPKCFQYKQREQNYKQSFKDKSHFIKVWPFLTFKKRPAFPGISIYHSVYAYIFSIRTMTVMNIYNIIVTSTFREFLFTLKERSEVTKMTAEMQVSLLRWFTSVSQSVYVKAASSALLRNSF